ncbi:MAG: c-type cytochrome [Helicobacteraceae bacterium]|jgi:cytochrome c oxidase cbb3-type subunit 3|nr:c-type cytochrome [Helicobacteraceae bacterium]
MGVEGLFGGSNATINILGAAGFFAVVLITAWVLAVYFKRIKEDKGDGQTEDGEWDGIKEYAHPIPVGWTICFILMLIWAIWYWLLGYPLNAYSQVGEYNQETTEWNNEFQNKWQNLSGGALVKMGEGLYLNNCAQCHGLTRDGNGGRAADLKALGYVGNPNMAPVVVSFAQFGTGGVVGGRGIGVMPAFESAGVLNEKQYEAIAAYVTSN